MCYGVDEALVELWGPHEAGALEGAGRFLAGGAGAEIAGVGEVAAGRGLLLVVGGGWVGGGWWLGWLLGVVVVVVWGGRSGGGGGGGWGVRVRDVEGVGEIGGD